MSERKWKPITGFEELYDLRDDGLLYSHTRNTSKRGRYRYGRIVGNGYLSHTLSKNGVTYYKRVNRLVYETFVGEIPDGCDVHHINQNQKDNRVENLEIIESKQHSRMHLEENPNKMINATKKQFCNILLMAILLLNMKAFQKQNELQEYTTFQGLQKTKSSIKTVNGTHLKRQVDTFGNTKRQPKVRLSHFNCWIWIPTSADSAAVLAT